jgi:hypothetical protein
MSRLWRRRWQELSVKEVSVLERLKADEVSLPFDRISLEMICGCNRAEVSVFDTSRFARLQRALHQAIVVFIISMWTICHIRITTPMQANSFAQLS